MRWIVISLVLINVLIFGWRWWASEPEVAVVAARQPTAEAHAIELLDDESEISSAVEFSTSAESASNESNDTNEVSTDIAGAGDTTAVDPIASAAPSETSVATSMPAQAVATAGPASTSPSVVTPPVIEAPAQFCAWTDWHAVPAKPESAAEAVKTETREQEIGRSYLVYIPGKASRELTLERLAELKAKGLEAAFLNKGPQVGGISLGLFSKEESLQTKLAELKSAGIADARGIERIRTETQQRQLWRWTGEKTPSAVINQQLVSCNDVAPAASGQ